MIPQKPPPPPRREAGDPIRPLDPVEIPPRAPDVEPDRPTIPSDPPASQPTRTAQRHRRAGGRIEIPPSTPPPEVIGRRADPSDPLM
ncbi:MAG: hypothetical protein K0Q89_849, partial [Thermomicrobiales bacterium]|nr:hypothetical protein [Thermomicrobiales bacterium]